MKNLLITGMLACLVGLCIGSVVGWKWNESSWQAKEQKRIAKDNELVEEKREVAQVASTKFEEKKVANEVQYRTVTVTLEKIVDRPVYLNQCLDDDGLRILNDQISGNPNPGKLGLRVPRSGTD